MNLTVLGATGGIGRHVVSQALDAGHHVTAYDRSPAKLNLTHACTLADPGDVRAGRGGATRTTAARPSPIGEVVAVLIVAVVATGREPRPPGRVGVQLHCARHH